MKDAYDDQPPIGVVVLRTEESLHSFNCEHVRNMVTRRFAAATPTPQAVLCHLSASPHVELAAAEMPLGLKAELRRSSIRLVVEARASVRERLRALGLEGRVGSINRCTAIADAVKAAATSPQPA
jgi:MFS superfamily sulfate permease-like transporter